MAKTINGGIIAWENSFRIAPIATVIVTDKSGALKLAEGIYEQFDENGNKMSAQKIKHETIFLTLYIFSVSFFSVFNHITYEQYQSDN